jgi:hypothetical protein
MKFRSTIHAIAIPLAVIWSLTASAQTADLIFTNGKIVTVDDQFATVQAVAIKGERGESSDLASAGRTGDAPHTVPHKQSDWGLVGRV